MESVTRSIIHSDFLPGKIRFEYWADVICKNLNPVELDSHSRENFDASLKILPLGDATYVFSEGTSPITAHRTNQHISLAENHFFHLLTRRSSSGLIKQGGNEASYGVGDFVLIDTKQKVVSVMDDLNFILISIPEALTRAWIKNPEDYVAQVISSEKGWAAVLSSYIRNLEFDVIAGTTPVQHALMVEHILSLYSFALEEACLTPKSDPFISAHAKTNLYRRMYNWLTEHYMNPDISATQMAQYFGVSIREVHRQFSLSSKGATFLETLRAMRMATAVRMLKDDNFSVLSISEIGERSGFDEPAYFGKVFRKMMGCSPGFFAKTHHQKNRG